MTDDLFEDDELFDDEDNDDEADADLEARIAYFEQKLTHNMKVLLTRKRPVDERVDAAYWLGESGAPKAISALRKVYRGEKDPKVRKAAGYALGQFKALDEAIDRDPNESVLEALGEEKNDHIRELLEKITLEGVEVKRSPISAGIVRRFAGLLIVGLIVLGILNVVVRQSATDDDPPIEVEDNLAAVVASYQGPEYVVTDEIVFNELRLMAGTVPQMRLAAARLDQTLDTDPLVCEREIDIPETYTLSETARANNTEIVAVAETLNEAGQSLQIAQGIYTTACERPAPVTLEQVESDRADDAISGAEEALSSTEAQIETLFVATVATPTPAAAPTDPIPPTQGPTLVPSETPVSTLSPGEERNYLQDLLAIIRDLNSTSGANTLLAQYWGDVQEFGNTGGCDLPRPTIPQLDPIPQRVLDSDATTLIDGWRQLDDALELLQSGWDLFFNACEAEGDIAASLELGLQTSATTSQLIQGANNTLLEVGS
jgi:hypothetical protein